MTAIALSVANFELPFPQESRLRIDFSGEEAQAQAFQWMPLRLQLSHPGRLHAPLLV